MGLYRKEASEVSLTHMAIEIGEASKGIGDAYQSEVTVNAKGWISKRKTLTPFQGLSSSLTTLMPAESFPCFPVRFEERPNSAP